MESTGKYWIPVYNILEKDCSIVLAHPKYVKAIRGKKTNKKDAKRIADLFKHDLVAGSFIPPADIRQLRDLMRYRFKLTCFKSSEKNRLQNSLTVSNIQLGNVVSDTFGKSAQAILDKLLENPADTSFDLEPLVYKSLKKKNFRNSVMPLTALLLLSRPTNSRSSKIIMKTLNPGKQNLKNSFLRSTLPISRNLPFFKPLLVQCANAVVKSTKHPEMRNRYLRLKKRRSHKKAIIAIARMLLTALYHMLKNGGTYNPELYRKTDLPPVDREITIEQALMLIRNQGYKIKSATT